MLNVSEIATGKWNKILISKKRINPTFFLNQSNTKVVKCPLDRNSFNSAKLFNDVAINREISAITVKCANENCGWTNKVSYLQVKQWFQIIII